MFHGKAHVVRVIDGDTIVVDIDLGFKIILKDIRVRLLGINTSEIRTKDEDVKARGLAAKARVEELLPPGSICVLKAPETKHDKHGRVLGYIILEDDRVLNDVLLEEGLAEKFME